MGKEIEVFRDILRYDTSLITHVIQEGLAEFGLTKSHHSRITIKPLVWFDLIIEAYPFLFLSWMRRLFKGRV